MEMVCMVKWIKLKLCVNKKWWVDEKMRSEVKRIIKRKIKNENNGKLLKKMGKCKLKSGMENCKVMWKKKSNKEVKVMR